LRYFSLKLGNLSNKISKLINKFKDPVTRNFVFIALNTGTLALFGFVFWVVVANFYSESSVGLNTFIYNTMALAVMISRFGLDISLIRFLPTSNSKLKFALLTTVISFILTLIISSITFLVSSYVDTEVSILRQFNFFSFCIIFSSLWSSFLLIDYVFFAIQKSEITFLKNLFFSIIRIPLIIAFLFMEKIGVMFGWGIAAIITLFCLIAILALYSYFKKDFPILDKENEKSQKTNSFSISTILSFSFETYIADLLYKTINFLSVIIATLFFGLINSAYIYISWMMATIVYAIPLSFSISLLSEQSKNDLEDDINKDEDIKKTHLRSLLFTLPVLVLGISFSKPILLLFGSGYANSRIFLIIMLVTSIPIIFNSIYISYLRYLKKTRRVILINLVIFCFTILSPIVLSNLIDINSIALGWLVGNILATIFIICDKKYFNIFLEGRGKTRNQPYS